ncbi:hypothetical protein LOY24_18040 [Pseudomonas putida]|uniref:hypothetical protein n=1 Tax=Pseudomonas putida TaxID=303 RepID=UPI002160DBC4|nr:hypothetical protein [Pseudomonas putida]UVL76626.1 hypothetical protein LOY24_18040 [Pseudomonas putida]
MVSDRIFQDHHLPNGMKIATNDDDSSEALERLAKAIMALEFSAADKEGDEHRNSAADDKDLRHTHTPAMTKITRNELAITLSAIEERMDRRVERMERDTERRNDEVRREIELRDTAARHEQSLRDRSLDDRLNAFLSIQAERDKAQLERDKRYEDLAERITKAAEGAEEAAKQAATVKTNYWAAVGVQLLAVAAILVGAYFANQGNALMVAQTTLAAFSSGKDSADPAQSTQTQGSPPVKASK